jgi:hypothetical protein
LQLTLLPEQSLGVQHCERAIHWPSQMLPEEHTQVLLLLHVNVFGQSPSFSHSTQRPLLVQIFEHGPHSPLQPSEPHCFPLHCFVHSHVPFEQVPGRPLVVQAIAFGAFCSTQRLPLPHLPTLQSIVSLLQSSGPSHSTH